MTAITHVKSIAVEEINNNFRRLFIYVREFVLLLQNIEYLFLLANQEYFLGNFQEAVKILTSIPVDGLKYR